MQFKTSLVYWYSKGVKSMLNSPSRTTSKPSAKSIQYPKESLHWPFQNTPVRGYVNVRNLTFFMAGLVKRKNGRFLMLGLLTLIHPNPLSLPQYLHHFKNSLRTCDVEPSLDIWTSLCLGVKDIIQPSHLQWHHGRKSSGFPRGHVSSGLRFVGWCLFIS